MHPYHNLVLHRGPSRLLWFLIGAGATTYWHYARDSRAPHFPCMTHHRRIQDSGAPSQEALTWRTERSYPQAGWEQDRERVRELQKRAGETVVDLSESTLDSIVAGAEALKAKLVQLRGERERLEAEKKVAPPAV